MLPALAVACATSDPEPTAAPPTTPTEPDRPTTTRPQNPTSTTTADGRAQTSTTEPPTEPPEDTTPPTTEAEAEAPPTTEAEAPPDSRQHIVERWSGVAPTEWGTHIGGLVEHVGGPAAIALTLDACGGPGGSGVDEAVLALLEREQIAATLFLNHRWIDANPRTVDRIAANPLFELANHGTRHLPLSVDGQSAYGIAGTQSAAEVVEEVGTNHDRLTAITGRRPRWYRPGTAHYDDVAVQIVQELGEHPTGFAVNGDFGATAAASTVRDALIGTPAGGIVLLHMNQPASATAAGIQAALPSLRAQSRQFVRLSDA